MTANRYLQILLLRWRVVAACVLLGIGLGALGSALLPKTYTAHSDVIGTVVPGSDVSAVQASDYVDGWLPDVVAIARSSMFAQRVAAALGPEWTPAGVRESLEFTVAPDTAVIEITGTSGSEERAQNLANEAATELTAPPQDTDIVAATDLDMRVLGDATSNAVTVSPRPIVLLGSGLIGGVLLGLVLAPLRNHLDQRFRRLTDFQHFFDAPILAVLGRPLRGRDRALGASTTAQGLFGRLSNTITANLPMYIAVGGVDGVGADVGWQLAKIASAAGFRTAVVSSHTSRDDHLYLERVSATNTAPSSIVIPIAERRVVTPESLAGALSTCEKSLDIVIFINDDLVKNQRTSILLERCSRVLLVCSRFTRIQSLHATRDLVNWSGCQTWGLVLIQDRRRGRPHSSRQKYLPLRYGVDRPASSEKAGVATHTDTHGTRADGSVTSLPEERSRREAGKQDSPAL